MSETVGFDPIFASTIGELECSCAFDQHGVIEVGDWLQCVHHACPVRVVRAQACAPPVVGQEPDTEIARVRILLNPDPLATRFGYRPGVPVRPVLAYLSPGTDHVWLCEQAWHVGNHDGHIPAGEPLDVTAAAELDEATARLIDPHTRELAAAYQRCSDRSVRPGDVVAIDDAFYACAGLGWESIDTPFIAHGPVPDYAPIALEEALAHRPVSDLLDDAA